MEIQFENTSINTYLPFFRQNRRIQLNQDGVVPDTNDDIGRIVSTQALVFLKGKENYNRRISVSGEIQTVIVYITEEEKQVSFVKLSKGFEIDFEDEEIDSGTQSQIRLEVVHTEARVLNPRKVSVTVELGAELTAYRWAEAAVKTKPSADSPDGLYVEDAEKDAYYIAFLGEKTFAFSEQYSFPDSQPEPKRLITVQNRLISRDVQQIGSRLILKGTVLTDVWYLADEISYPLYAQFSSPFSQILDAGEFDFRYGRTELAATAAYCDLVDTISGDKALDLELHAVLQMVSYCVQRLQYISDAYSNRVPLQCDIREQQLLCSLRSDCEILTGTDTLPIANDCSELLCTFASVTQKSYDNGRLTASVALDILYLTKAGTLSVANRSVTLAKEIPQSAVMILGAHVKDLNLRLEGDQVNCRIGVECMLESSEHVEIAAVEAIEMDTEHAYDVEAYPTLSLVRVDNESLWELAKRYHSSVESIEMLNELTEPLQGKLLIVPKQL